ncbi:hypothetical protein Hokovirus_1_293 [Hokovirus HKV1]|uniref:U-box domain-containing protein n=1 Tax=Hokovirus HKV1 TaxID=1977638 RepID=A0A1V0SFJ5_9VIRU|nr:hypothetical protein Hokovirus_1_293 [Hokovirus HKV1]
MEELIKNLYCPITHLLFNDPVLLVEDDIIYEKDAIVEWFKKHDTSPITRKIISNPTYKSVKPIINMVDQVLKSNPELISEQYFKLLDHTKNDNGFDLIIKEKNFKEIYKYYNFNIIKIIDKYAEILFLDIDITKYIFDNLNNTLFKNFKLEIKNYEKLGTNFNLANINFKDYILQQKIFKPNCHIINLEIINKAIINHDFKILFDYTDYVANCFLDTEIMNNLSMITKEHLKYIIDNLYTIKDRSIIVNFLKNYTSNLNFNLYLEILEYQNELTIEDLEILSENTDNIDLLKFQKMIKNIKYNYELNNKNNEKIQQIITKLPFDYGLMAFGTLIMNYVSVRGYIKNYEIYKDLINKYPLHFYVSSYGYNTGTINDFIDINQNIIDLGEKYHVIKITQNDPDIKTRLIINFLNTYTISNMPFTWILIYIYYNDLITNKQLNDEKTIEILNTSYSDTFLKICINNKINLVHNKFNIFKKYIDIYKHYEYVCNNIKIVKIFIDDYTNANIDYEQKIKITTFLLNNLCLLTYETCNKLLSLYGNHMPKIIFINLLKYYRCHAKYDDLIENVMNITFNKIVINDVNNLDNNNVNNNVDNNKNNCNNNVNNNDIMSNNNIIDIIDNINNINNVECNMIVKNHRNIDINNYQDPIIKSNIYINILNFMTNHKYQKTQDTDILINSINISNSAKDLLKKYVLEDFTFGNLHIKYSELLTSMLYYIMNQNNKDQLLKILDQEIIDTRNQNSDYIFTKTINVLSSCI